MGSTPGELGIRCPGFDEWQGCQGALLGALDRKAEMLARQHARWVGYQVPWL